MTSENLTMYISWRDDFLKIIGDEICKECTDPIKNTKVLDYDNPFNCECKCHRIENILASATNIDAEIKLLTNS